MNSFDARLARLEAALTPAEPDPEAAAQERLAVLFETMDPGHVELCLDVWERGPVKRPVRTGPERLASMVDLLVDWAGRSGAALAGFKLALPAVVAEAYLDD